MNIVIEEQIPVYLTPDDARLFVEFQKRYQVIGQLLGSMDALKISDMKNVSIVMDLDGAGKLQHTAITKHYR